ncbi:ExbD/TolR family protein [Erythrobacter sp. HA6-11]
MPRTTIRPNAFFRKPPMGEMNVTPFIDVLLVLLIMIMMSVPIATHKTEIDLPGEPTGMANPVLNTVYIDPADQLFWNGDKVSGEQLSANVAYAASLPEEPLLRFEPDAYASYDRSARTIALIKDAGATRFAFIGNEKHREFGR